MYELSQQIIAYFTGKTAFTDIVSNNIYAVIAPEEQSFPFVSFLINQQAPLSRDGDEFNVTLFLWFDENKYDELLQFIDTVTQLVKENKNWNWEDSSFQLFEENISYFGIINFKKV